MARIASRLSDALMKNPFWKCTARSSRQKSDNAELIDWQQDGCRIEESGSSSPITLSELATASSSAEAKYPLPSSGNSPLEPGDQVVIHTEEGADAREAADLNNDVEAPSSSTAPPKDLLRASSPGTSKALVVTPRRSRRLRGLPPLTPTPPPRPKASKASTALLPERKRKLLEPPRQARARFSLADILRTVSAECPSHRVRHKTPSRASKAKSSTRMKVQGMERPNTLQPPPRQQRLLRVPALAKIPASAFETWQSLDTAAKRSLPKRCRMPPIQTWRNERLVYERTAKSRTPSLVAVEVDMTTSKASQAAPRRLQLPALQAPLQALEASEFVGICTSRLTSRVLALPDRPEAEPCTVSVQGPGILHVLDGSLRIAKEGAAREMQLSKGAFMLLKDSDKRLIAPPLSGRNSGRITLGVRVLFVEVR